MDRKSLKLITWRLGISKMMTTKHRNSKTLHREHVTMATVSDMPICLSGPGRRFLKKLYRNDHKAGYEVGSGSHTT